MTKLIVNTAEIKLYYEYKFFLKNGDSVRATVAEIKDDSIVVGDGALFTRLGIEKVENYTIDFDNITGALDEENCENYAMAASKTGKGA